MTSLSRRQTFKLRPIPLMLTAALAALGGTAYAADDGSMSTQTAEKISITGSNVRRTDSETPSPVQIITSQELKNSGYTTVAQVLQSITANGQGTLSQGFPQAFASGASGISLHGLNTSATLVLIDGHRMAPYPLSDDGQRSFVDISNIPFDAVERIEVLKDGASAIYGSDAMAGVVNIILRKSFVGTTATGEMGTTTEGGGKTSHASVIHGWGDLDSDGYNAYLSAEYRHQDNITYGQRSGHLWSSTDLSSIGGQNHTPGAVTPDNPQPPTGNGQVYLTDPTLNYGDPNSYYFFPGKCNYALQQANGCQFQNTHLEIEPRTQNVNLLGSFTKKLEGGWTLGLKASLFDSQAEQYTPYAGTVFPQSFSPLVSVAAGRNPTIVGTSIPQITIPANYPGNALGVPAIVNGVIPGSPLSHTEVESKATRIAADLSGSIGAWDIDSSAGYTAVSTTQTVYGTVNVPALNAALNRPVNPFSITGGNTAADMAAIFPTTSASDNSYLEFVELHASRSLMKLPGGDLGVSTGVSYTDRTMHSPAPDLIANGIVNGNNAYVSGSQTNESLYGEVVAPVFKSLELDGSARYDHFDSGAAKWTPKLGFKWTPSEMFALRGTIGKGFRAPNPAENGQSGQAYLVNTIADPILCPGGIPSSGNIAAGSVVSTCNFQPVYLNSANPSLKPETSTASTLGVIFEPIKGWSSTFDLYQVEIRNQIVAGSPDITQAVRSAPVSTLCADGNGGTVTCTPSTGQILYIPVEYVNANSTKTSGIEFDTNYRFNLGEYGKLRADLQWTHIMSYILKIDGVNYGLAGTHGPLVIGGDTANPRDRIQATLTWDRGPWEVAGTVNYISSYNLTDPSFGADDCAAGATIAGWFPSSAPPSQYCKVSSFVDTDVSVHYAYDKHLTIFGSVTNLFNKQPPVDIGTYGGGLLPYNPSMHYAGAIGRFVNAGATYKF